MGNISHRGIIYILLSKLTLLYRSSVIVVFKAIQSVIVVFKAIQSVIVVFKAIQSVTVLCLCRLRLKL